MSPAEKARQFSALHVKGQPLTLTNIWDAGTAKAVADSGAVAIATSSWSIAAAQGYPDGEALPLDRVEETVRRIAATVSLPISVDFEGGYAVEPEAVADNVMRVVAAGAIGINFEDGVVGAGTLHDIGIQGQRIAAVRARGVHLGIDLFINARTDLFLQASSADQHPALLDAAIERARAYQQAGASGFFVPGLVDEQLIHALCAATDLPVNIMLTATALPIARFSALGVSRISYGPLPFVRCLQHLQNGT